MLSLTTFILVLSMNGPAQGRTHREAPFHSAAKRRADGGFSILVFDSHKRVVLRKASLADATDWTPDRSTFAFADAGPSPYRTGYNIFVWKPRKALEKVVIRPLAHDYGEAIFPKGLKLAPDGVHALLLVAATQGDLDLGEGVLLCVGLKTHLSRVVDSVVAPGFRWEGADTVNYEQVDENGKLVKMPPWKVDDQPRDPTYTRGHDWANPPKQISGEAEIRTYMDRISASTRFIRLNLRGLQLLCVNADIGSGIYIPKALVYVKRKGAWRLAAQRAWDTDAAVYDFRVRDGFLSIYAVPRFLRGSGPVEEKLVEVFTMLQLQEQANSRSN